MVGIHRSLIGLAVVGACVFLVGCRVGDIIPGSSNPDPGGSLSQTESMSMASGPITPRVQWSSAVGNIDAAPDEIDGISVDDAGNTVVSGVFRGQVNLGKKTYNSSGGDDIFLASFSRDGSLNWAQQFGGPGLDNTFDLTTDGSGNIYLSGWFSGVVDFGGQTLSSRGATDMFVAKFDTSGNVVWARQFGGEQGDGGNEIAVTASGEIAVSMITEGSVSIDGRNYAFGGGKRDAFVIRMGTDGQVLWVSHVNSPGTERIRALAISPQGDVYAGFQFHKQLRITGADGQTRSLSGVGHWDGALARLDPNGRVAWVHPVMSAENDNVRGIGVGSDNEIYASGKIQGAAQVVDRQVPLPGKVSGDKKGIDYVLKVNKAGQFQWIVGTRSNIKAIGGELQADPRLVITSSLQRGGGALYRIAAQGGPEKIGNFEATHSAPMANLMGLSPSGDLLFNYIPDPVSEGSGSFGDTVSLSRNGRFLVQALRFRETISVAGRSLSTSSKKDSAIVFLTLQ